MYTTNFVQLTRCLYFPFYNLNYVALLFHEISYSGSNSQLIERADRKLFKLIQVRHHCLTILLPSSRLPQCTAYSRYSLISRGHQFSLLQLNTVLYRNMFIN